MRQPFQVSLFLVLVALMVTSGGVRAQDPPPTQPPKAPVDAECEGTDWVTYRDLKCFKLIKQFATREQAVALCAKEQISASESHPPILATVKSEDEQTFLTRYLFTDSAVKSSVWLGAKRNLAKVTEFLWDDGTVMGGDYTNWVETGGPAKEAGRDCVQILSRFTVQHSGTKVDVDGLWEDVTCELANYVVCQKLPKWSFAKLQQTLIDVRRYGADSQEQLVRAQAQLEETKKELTDTKGQLAAAQGRLDKVERDPVPKDFIYVQFAAQPEPHVLWPAVNWTEVTGDYAGFFFRAEGAGSEPFGKNQAENAPRLVEIAQGTRGDVATFGTHLDFAAPPAELSPPIFTGDAGTPPQATKDGLRFRMSVGEVRPKNQAVKIWKRV